jgi:hypothetical protein
MPKIPLVGVLIFLPGVILAWNGLLEVTPEKAYIPYCNFAVTN